MVPVTAKTKIERSKSDFACPDAGDRMLGTFPPPTAGTWRPTVSSSHRQKATTGKAPIARRPATVSLPDDVDESGNGAAACTGPAAAPAAALPRSAPAERRFLALAATAPSKLKSVGAFPVIRRAPRLNVRSWIAHWMKTSTRLWNWTRYITWMNAQTAQAGRPDRWIPKTFAMAFHR